MMFITKILHLKVVKQQYGDINLEILIKTEYVKFNLDTETFVKSLEESQ